MEFNGIAFGNPFDEHENIKIQTQGMVDRFLLFQSTINNRPQFVDDLVSEYNNIRSQGGSGFGTNLYNLMHHANFGLQSFSTPYNSNVEAGIDNNVAIADAATFSSYLYTLNESKGYYFSFADYVLSGVNTGSLGGFTIGGFSLRDNDVIFEITDQIRDQVNNNATLAVLGFVASNETSLNEVEKHIFDAVFQGKFVTERVVDPNTGIAVIKTGDGNALSVSDNPDLFSSGGQNIPFSINYSGLSVFDESMHGSLVQDLQVEAFNTVIASLMFIDYFEEVDGVSNLSFEQRIERLGINSSLTSVSVDGPIITLSYGSGEIIEVQRVEGQLTVSQPMAPGAGQASAIQQFCFASGTPVMTPDGEKFIEDIKVGDLVLAFDCFGDLVPKAVSATHQNSTKQFYELDSGLLVTPGHPFLTPSGKFEAISSILSGEGQVVLADGSIRAISGKLIQISDTVRPSYRSFDGSSAINMATQSWPTYNLTVDDLHTFVAGGFRVHNTSIGTHIPDGAQNVRITYLRDGFQEAQFDISPEHSVSAIGRDFDSDNATDVIQENHYLRAEGTSFNITRNISRIEVDGETTFDSDLEITDIEFPGYRLTGEQAGRAIGSHFGKFIAGDNVLAQVATGTLLGTIAQNVGETLHIIAYTADLPIDAIGTTPTGQSLLSQQAGAPTTSLAADIEDAFDDFDVDFTNNLKGAVSGALTSILLSEVVSTLDLGATGEVIFNTVAGEFTNNLISSALDVATGVEGATLEIFATGSLADGTTVPSLDASLINIGNAFGSYLGNTVADAFIEQEGGIAGGYIASLFSLVGSFAGNFIPIPVVGSFIGSLIGKAIGNALSQWDAAVDVFEEILDDVFGLEPRAEAFVNFNYDVGEFVLGNVTSDDNGNEALAESLADGYIDTLNFIVETVGGTVRNDIDLQLSSFGHFWRDSVVKDYVDGVRVNTVSFDDENRLGSEITQAALRTAATIKVDGTDPLRARAAFENAVHDIPALFGNLEVAEQYRFYLENTATINTLIQYAPETADAQGWLLTLVRADELGLNGDYVVVGGDENGLIRGADGDDELTGLDQNEVLRGYAGNDSLIGGAGADQLVGDSGNDELFGGAGDDVLQAGAGLDLIDGGDGIDTLSYEDFFVGVSVDLSLGETQIDGVLKDSFASVENVTATIRDDFIAGDGNANVLLGLDGDDVFFGSGGADELDGGDGQDHLSYQSSSEAINVDLETGVGTGGDADLDTLRNIEDVTGSLFADVVAGDGSKNILRGLSGADALSGGLADDVLDGGADNDHLLGGGNADFLVGGDGSDILEGGFGLDELRGGEGDDTLIGGWGSDTYVHETLGGHDLIVEGHYEGIADTLDLKDFSFTDATFFRSWEKPEDVIISLAGGASSVTLAEQVLIDHGVEKVEFSDQSIYWDDLNEAANSLVGSVNDDDIYGLARVDHIDGGIGDDLLAGAQGDDVYVVRAGEGHDRIEEQQYGGDDTVRLAEIAAADVSISMLGSDVILSFDGGSVTLANEFQFTSGLVETIEFSDVVWNIDDLRAAVGLAPLPINNGDVTIWSTNGSADDVYTFGEGSGWVRIEEPTNRGVDTLILSGLNPEDITVTTEIDATAANGYDTTIAINSTGESVTIANGIYNGLSFDGGVERIEFDDGTVWESTSRFANFALRAQAVRQGDNTSEVILGGTIAEQFNGGAGDDILEGGKGDDTYIFRLGDGHDRIVENTNGGSDRLILEALNPDDVVVTMGVNGSYDVKISTLITGESVTIESAAYNGLANDGGVEFIEFADGTVWDGDSRRLNHDLVRAAVRQGSELDETITGSGDVSLDERFNGGAGNDLLQGGKGDDTYIYREGDGHDRIEEASNSGIDKLILTDVTPDEVVVTLGIDGSFDATLNILPTGETVTIANAIYNGLAFDGGVEEIEFADGTVWSGSSRYVNLDLGAEAIRQGTGESETIIGSGSVGIAERFMSGAGDDLLLGGDGDDIYIYQSGDGHDRIEEYGNEGVDTLILTGINPDDVSVSLDHVGSYDTTINILSTGDSITIANGIYNGLVFDGGVDRIEFADGTVWDGNRSANFDLRAEAVRLGGLLDETIVGGDELGEVFDGGGGADILRGGGGDDVYRFSIGSGHDVIEELVSGGEDTLQFIDINLDDVDFSTAIGSSALVITVKSTQERVEIVGGLEGGFRQGIEKIEFADATFDGGASVPSILRQMAVQQGTYLSDNASGTAVDDVIDGLGGDDSISGGGGADVIDGGSGNDHLEGGAGDDTLRGGLGDDVLIGGEGIDTYEGGFGSDTGDFSASSESGSVTFDLIEGEVRWESGFVESFTSVENVIGTDGIDTMIGDASDNRFEGGGNDDTLNGGAGNDVLSGGDGIDVLNGGADTDYLEGGAGADILDGGEGATDWARYLSSEAGVTVDLGAGTGVGGDAEGDQLSNIERVDGSAFDDVLTGNDEANYLRSRDGDDTLNGGAGNDVLSGGEGIDTFVFSTSAGADTILDFDDGSEVIRFEDTELSFSDLSISASGANSIVDYGSGTVNIRNVTVDLLDQEDFVFA